jgi:hypothetical protein
MNSSNYDKIDLNKVVDEGVHRHAGSRNESVASSRKLIKAKEETCSLTAKERVACIGPCMSNRAILWKVSSSRSTASKKENLELVFVHGVAREDSLSFPNSIKFCLILMMHAIPRPLAALHLGCFVFACTNHIRWVRVFGQDEVWLNHTRPHWALRP